MFSRLLRALFAPAERGALSNLAEESGSQTPPKPDTPLKLYRFKGMSCYLHADDKPGRNGAGGFACHRDIPGGLQILALSPCLDMKDDCRTLRDEKLRSNIVGVEPFRRGNFAHQDHGTVYWILSRSVVTVDYDYFWEERPRLILHLTGSAPRHADWEPAVRFAAATMRGEAYRAPVLVRGLALERQDDGGVRFHFSDPDPDEPLRPQSFYLDPEQFDHWVEVCTRETFRLQQGSDVLVSEPLGSGVQFETSDHYGPHLSAQLGPEELEQARSFS